MPQDTPEPLQPDPAFSDMLVPVVSRSESCPRIVTVDYPHVLRIERAEYLEEIETCLKAVGRIETEPDRQIGPPGCQPSQFQQLLRRAAQRTASACGILEQ